MITNNGFINFAMRLKFCLASVLIGAILGSYFGYMKITKNMSDEQVNFLATYLVSTVATSAGLNHSISGNPTKFRQELDAMKSSYPNLVFEAKKAAQKIFIYPWLSVGAVVGFFVFLIINYSIWRRSYVV